MTTLRSLKTRMRSFQQKRREHLILYCLDTPDAEFERKLAEFHASHTHEIEDGAMVIGISESYGDIQ